MKVKMPGHVRAPLTLAAMVLAAADPDRLSSCLALCVPGPDPRPQPLPWPLPARGAGGSHCPRLVGRVRGSEVGGGRWAGQQRARLPSRFPPLTGLACAITYLATYLPGMA